MVALSQLAHGVLVLLHAFHHAHELVLVFSQSDKKLHGCIVFKQALDRLPCHGKFFAACLGDDIRDHAQVHGTFLPVLELRV